jgi:hypothetical protein
VTSTPTIRRARIDLASCIGSYFRIPKLTGDRE